MTIETIYINVPDIDQSELPLLADIQWLEPYGANALNRKLAGVFDAGILRGFTPVPSVGLAVDLLHNQNLNGSATSQGVALVERNDYLLTVHQQKTITVPVVAGQKTYIVLNAFYQDGIKTKQVDKDSVVEAAELLALTEAELEPHHVTVCAVTLEAGATAVLPENIEVYEPRDNILPQYVMKTGDRLAMVVPIDDDETKIPPDGLQRWNPTKRRMESSKGGRWNGMGGGGSTLSVVSVDTELDSGSGCLVDTKLAAKQVVVKLSQSPSEGDEHIVGDDSLSAFKYPIKVVPDRTNGATTTIDKDDEFLIDIDGARVTFNYNAVDDNWELSSGFGERSTPKAIYDRYESYPAVGTTVFNVPYTEGYVDVLLNGAELARTDFTATDGNTITLHKPTKRDAVVVIKAYKLCDKIEDIVYTRKHWLGTVKRGDLTLPATGLENDVAKAYRLVIGGAIQIPDKDYTISSATNEVVLMHNGQPTASDGDYEWSLLAEAQVTLFEGRDSEITATNTNNSLSGSNVKENIDELDAKIEAKVSASNPNLLINGDGAIAQRSSYRGGVTSSNGEYGVDRFITIGTGNTQRSIRYDDEPTFTFPSDSNSVFQIFKSGSSNGWRGFASRQEANVVSGMSQEIHTLSFKYRVTDYTGDSFVLRVTAPNAHEDFSDLATLHNISIDFSDDWAEYTIAIPANALYRNGMQFQISIEGDANDAAIVYLADVKLERGSVATPFIPDDPATNLAKCQRYYQKLYIQELRGYQSANAAIHNPVLYPSVMRDVPMCSYAVNATLGLINHSVTVNTTGMMLTMRKNGVTGDCYMNGLNIELDAEL